MLGAEREHDGVVVGRRLQLEVERDAEPLAQRQPQGAVHPASEGGVDDELRALALVEAALDHDPPARRQVAERLEPGGAVGHDLLGHLLGHPGPLAHEVARPQSVAGAQHRLEGGAQVADGLGQLGRAGGGLAQPERDGGRQVAGVVHPDRAHLDLGHPPGVGAQQEDVACCGLDREVFVHRAHRDAVGVEHDAVVARLGDGPTAGQRGQARPAPGAEAPIDGIVVQVGAAATPTGLDAPAHQGHDVVEVGAVQLGVGRGTARHLPQRVDVALVGRCHLGHELLGQHVERGHRRLEQVEAALAHRGQQGGALDQLVARRRVEAPGRRAVPVVVGPADPLQERADGTRGADLADQLDGPDVDAELERCRGHQGAQVARPQPGLDDAPARRGEAAVVGGDEQGRVDVAVGPGSVGVPEALGQLVRHPLGHLARVDEHERRAMVTGVLGDAVEDVGHLAAAHDGLQLGGRELDRHLEVAGVPAVDDDRCLTPVVHTGEEARHQVEWPLRGREPDALQAAARLGHQRVETLEAERQVAATLVAGQRVHLVHDHGAHAAQQGARGRRGEQQVEGLGRGDEQIRRLLLHGGTLGRWRVPGANGHPQTRVGHAETGRLLADLGEGDVQVLVHVDCQRAEWRDVEDLGPAAHPFALLGGAIGGVDGDQEPGQRLARARGRGHQDVAPGGDVGPRGRLRRRRPRRESAREPARHGRVEECLWRSVVLEHLPIPPGCCDRRGRGPR